MPKLPFRDMTAARIRELCESLKDAQERAEQARFGESETNPSEYSRAESARWILTDALSQAVGTLTAYTDEAQRRKKEHYEGNAIAHAARDRQNGTEWVCKCNACRTARKNGFTPPEPTAAADVDALFQRGRAIVKGATTRTEAEAAGRAAYFQAVGQTDPEKVTR